MSESDRFIANLERTVRSQFKSQKVGYLLGAGASYLNGNGYPLSYSIWDFIKDDIPEKEKKEIQAKLDIDGTEGLEHALDLLDPGGPNPTSHRVLVTTAIANHFSQVDPPFDKHCEFFKRI